MNHKNILRLQLMFLWGVVMQVDRNSLVSQLNEALDVLKTTTTSVHGNRTYIQITSQNGVDKFTTVAKGKSSSVQEINQHILKLTQELLKNNNKDKGDIDLCKNVFSELQDFNADVVKYKKTDIFSRIMQLFTRNTNVLDARTYLNDTRINSDIVELQNPSLFNDISVALGEAYAKFHGDFNQFKSSDDYKNFQNTNQKELSDIIREVSTAPDIPGYSEIESKKYQPVLEECAQDYFNAIMDDDDIAMDESEANPLIYESFNDALIKENLNRI